VLARAAARRARRIVLQPHLLFPGALAAQTRGSAQAAARDFPAIDWVVAEPLGPHPLLAEAVCDIVARAPAWCEPAGAAQRRG